MSTVQRWYFGPQIDSGTIRSEKSAGGVPTFAAARAGGLVFTNGVVSNDPETGAVVGGDIRIQTRRVLETLRDGLRQAGTGFDHVVLVQSFIKSIDDWPAYHEVYLEFFDEHRPPPRYTVTADLAAPELLIEIQMIAAIPDH